MRQPKQVNWIAVDWGTTHLRAYGLSSDHQLIKEAVSGKGMGVLANDEFEPALLALIADWLPETGQVQGHVKVLACGMVGARQGWKEAHYQSVPCSPFADQNLTAVKTVDQRIQVKILPGISQAKPADVMRGEETQLAGLLSSQDIDSARVCLPGTHSKWALIEKGELMKFSTFMTGEMFEILSKHSILRHQTDNTHWNKAAFLSGVESSIEHPDKLLNECFSIRAQSLLENLEDAEARSRLSGLLIGAELAGAREYWQGSNIALIGDLGLSELYAQALALMSVETKTYDPKAVTLAGLIKVYKNHLKVGGET